MLRRDTEIRQLIKARHLSVSSQIPLSTDTASVDLHLSPQLRWYESDEIDLGGAPAETTESIMPAGGHVLEPGAFVLGCTVEYLVMPLDHYGFIEATSAIARAGLLVHLNSRHVDAGFQGSLTLEMLNTHSATRIRLRPEIAICQLFILPLSGPVRSPYLGGYSGRTAPVIR